METQTKDPFIPALTSEQWAGLARLGDLANGAEQFMGSPAGVLPMEVALRAGDWNERFDLTGGLEELLETIQALRQAGALRLIRENASFVTESLTLLAPLMPKIIAALENIPFAKSMASIQMGGDFLSRINMFMDFLKGPAGNDLVSKIKELGDLWEETDANTTIVAALRVLKQLQEDGNLQRIADFSSQINHFTETIDLKSLPGQLIQKSTESSIPATVTALLQSGRSLTRALTEATEHESNVTTGGLSGLYHMLKDPDVQRGMRIIAVLPVYLEKSGVFKKPDKTVS